MSASLSVEKSENIIAFFDFDGTLTSKDSLAEFIQFAVGKRAYWSGLIALFPVLLLFKFGVSSNQSAKEKLISFYFKGLELERFKNLADRYSTEHIDEIIRPEAMAKIYWHQHRGHKIVIVSASIESWLEKWCENHSIELIATRLEFRDGKLTGKFATKNCHGVEKVNRIHQRYSLRTYDSIYAYGDSPSDKAMLSLADKPFYRSFE